jgi:transcriptional regulator with XRE-family HTH domain
LPYNEAGSYRRRLTWESAAMIKRARLAKGWTLAEAAKTAGITEAFWWMLENQHRAPSMTTAQAIARVLGLDWDQAEMLYSESVENAGRSKASRSAGGC